MMPAHPVIEPLPLAEAQDAIRAGAKYAAVYPAVAESDRDALAEWFVHAKGVPVLAKPAARKPESVATGNLCPRCGGLMVRTGTCLTCQSCGDSSGGCG